MKMPWRMLCDDYNKYGWRRLVFVVDTSAGLNNISRQVEQIQILDMHHQSHVNFGLLGIGNVGNQFLPNTLVISALQNSDNNAS